MNLLENKTFNNLIKQGIFPGLFQFFTFIVLVLIMIWSWPYHNIEGVSAADPLIYTNLGNLLFWIYWMMGVIILALLSGRIWCAVCPIGMINGIAGKFGLKMNYPSRLRNWYMLIVFFVILQITINLTKLNHYPDMTARLIFVFILLGLVYGFLFRGRAFCRYLCPIGSMIGIYSCISPFELRVKDKAVCLKCSGKECARGKTNSYSVFLGNSEFPLINNAVPCPADIFPASLDENTHCYFCAQCAKLCPNNNILLNTRNIFKEIFTPHERHFSEILFIVLLLGMVLEKFVPMWPALQKIIFPESLPSFIFYPWIYLILPGIIVLLPSLLIYLVSSIRIVEAHEKDRQMERAGLNKIFSFGGGIFIPLIFFSHLALAILKLFTRGGYIFYGLIDPAGVKTYRAIFQAELFKAPSGIIPITVLRWIVLLFVMAGCLLSLVSVFKINKTGTFNKNSYAFSVINLSAVLAVGLMFVLIIKNWLFI